MVVINVIMITLGQVIAYAIGAGFESIHGGWRWMVGLDAVPAGLQVLFLFILPESRKSSSIIISVPFLQRPSVNSPSSPRWRKTWRSRERHA